MTTKEIIQTYYNSLNQKDDRWQDLWADDATFSDASRVLVANGKAEIIQSFTTFLRGVERVQVKQLIIEGKSACAVVSYDYVNPKGAKLSQDVAEVSEVRDGKLAKQTVYFDLTAYRQFMSG
jgi:ketosteroid isomerase-like protein